MMIRRVLCASLGLILVLGLCVGVAASTGAVKIEVAYRDISIFVNGTAIASDVEPFIYQGRTFVPIRFVSEALGQPVSWDNENSRVIIGTPPMEQPQPTATPTGISLMKGRIAFYSERDGNPEIYTMNPDGGDLQRLTNDPGQDICPAFSPDGSRIAFSSNRDGNSEIYTMKRDGTDPKRVTNTPENELAPDWSPDGTKILYVSFSSKTWDASNIFVCNADGSGWKQLTDATGVSERPGYSQDGSKIIFHSNRDGNFEIYTMNADGSN
ncbi:MAG: stalk domain-containing protein, partial [Coprothermobacterota bacterium]|nr:stalk domain-containing protein [Coprothermobacterota bacterium]